MLARGCLAVQDGFVAALTSADVALHMRIHQAAGNPLLTETLRLYWLHLRRSMVAVVKPSQGREQVWDKHHHILQAVLGGQQQAAERMSLLHIQVAAQRVMRRLPEEPAPD